MKFQINETNFDFFTDATKAAKKLNFQLVSATPEKDVLTFLNNNEKLNFIFLIIRQRGGEAYCKLQSRFNTDIELTLNSNEFELSDPKTKLYIDVFVQNALLLKNKLKPN